MTSSKKSMSIQGASEWLTVANPVMSKAQVGQQSLTYSISNDRNSDGIMVRGSNSIKTIGPGKTIEEQKGLRSQSLKVSSTDIPPFELVPGFAAVKATGLPIGEVEEAVEGDENSARDGQNSKRQVQAKTHQEAEAAAWDNFMDKSSNNIESNCDYQETPEENNFSNS